jgi:hypothetical protein
MILLRHAFGFTYDFPQRHRLPPHRKTHYRAFSTTRQSLWYGGCAIATVSFRHTAASAADATSLSTRLLVILHETHRQQQRFGTAALITR